ncbi:hypothetical protein [Amycolatopsis sp. cmx-11-32]|uniref:hypothetical protein n=1 Tax=Amycolatopsis sp. cmx-11-32 TaxID=2785796 RepID=UPI0039E64E4C
MSSENGVDGPTRPGAHRWTTFKYTRKVLVAAHNVTTLTRLLDVIPAFDNDERVQLFFTHLAGDPFRHGLNEAMTNAGALILPWKEAKGQSFDLAISASHHGALDSVNAPRVVLSHGIGYTKYSPQRAAGSGQRAAGSGQRAAGSGQRAAGSFWPFH